MKKGIIKALGITALVAVGAVGGMALGAEIANGFQKTYSESDYIEYGDKKKEEGYKQGFEAGQEQTGGYTEEDLEEAVNVEVDKWQDFTTLLSGGRHSSFDLEIGTIYFSNDVEGVYLYKKDGTLDKVIKTGSNFTWLTTEDGMFIYSEVDKNACGLYYISNDGKTATLTDGYFNADFSVGENYIQYMTPEGVFNFSTETLENTLLFEGVGWYRLGYYDGTGFYYSNTSLPGLYRVNGTDVEEVASEGYNYLEALEYYKKDGERLLFWLNSDGLVEINEDKTTNLIIDSPNLQMFLSETSLSNMALYDENNIYYFSLNDNEFKAISTSEIGQVEYGYNLKNNNYHYIKTSENNKYIIKLDDGVEAFELVNLEEDEDIIDANDFYFDYDNQTSYILVLTNTNKIYNVSLEDATYGTATLVTEHENAMQILCHRLPRNLYTVIGDETVNYYQSVYVTYYTAEGEAVTKEIVRDIYDCHLVEILDGYGDYTEVEVLHLRANGESGERDIYVIPDNDYEIIEE